MWPAIYSVWYLSIINTCYIWFLIDLTFDHKNMRLPFLNVQLISPGGHCGTYGCREVIHDTRPVSPYWTSRGQHCYRWCSNHRLRSTWVEIKTNHHSSGMHFSLALYSQLCIYILTICITNYLSCLFQGYYTAVTLYYSVFSCQYITTSIYPWLSFILI